MSGHRRRGSLDPSLLGRLAEAGLLASECGLHDEAEVIFSSLVKVKPGMPLPLIALAMVQARRGLAERAIDELRGIIANYPDSEMAKAVLGILLVQSRQPGALRLFEEIRATGEDQSAVNMADCCIAAAREQESETGAAVAQPLEYFRHHNVRP